MTISLYALHSWSIITIVMTTTIIIIIVIVIYSKRTKITQGIGKDRFF